MTSFKFTNKMEPDMDVRNKVKKSQILSTRSAEAGAYPRSKIEQNLSIKLDYAFQDGIKLVGIRSFFLKLITSCETLQFK